MKLQVRNKTDEVFDLSHKFRMQDKAGKRDIKAKKMVAGGGYWAGSGEAGPGVITLEYTAHGATEDEYFENEALNLEAFLLQNQEPYFLEDVDNNFRWEIRHQQDKIKDVVRYRVENRTITLPTITPHPESLDLVEFEHSGLSNGDSLDGLVNDGPLKASPVFEITAIDDIYEIIIIHGSGHFCGFVNDSFKSGTTVILDFYSGNITFQGQNAKIFISAGGPFHFLPGLNKVSLLIPSSGRVDIKTVFRRRFLR